MLHNTPSKKLEPWLKAIRKKEETLSNRESLPFDLDEAWAKLEEALPAKQVSAPKSRRHLTWHAWVGMAASFALVVGIAWSIWSSLEHQAIAPDQPLIAQQNGSAQSPQSPDFMEAPLSIPTTPSNQHHEKANDAVHYKEVYTENLDIKETLLPREEIAPDEASSSDEPSTPTPQRNMGPERDLSTPSYQDMRTPVYSDFTPQVRTGVFLCNNISSQSQRNTPNSFDGGGGDAAHVSLNEPLFTPNRNCTGLRCRFISTLSTPAHRCKNQHRPREAHGPRVGLSLLLPKKYPKQLWVCRL